MIFKTGPFEISTESRISEEKYEEHNDVISEKTVSSTESSFPSIDETITLYCSGARECKVNVEIDFRALEKKRLFSSLNKKFA